MFDSNKSLYSMIWQDILIHYRHVPWLRVMTYLSGYCIGHQVFISSSIWSQLVPTAAICSGAITTWHQVIGKKIPPEERIWNTDTNTRICDYRVYTVQFCPKTGTRHKLLLQWFRVSVLSKYYHCFLFFWLHDSLCIYFFVSSILSFVFCIL